MLKYENKFKIGDTLRSFDFEPSEGRTDRYIEGVITDIDLDHNQGFKLFATFVVECTVDSWDATGSDGKYSRVGTEIFVPIEISHEFDGRLTKVSKDPDVWPRINR